MKILKSNVFVVLALAIAACDNGSAVAAADGTAMDAAATADAASGPAPAPLMNSDPNEWVAFHTELPLPADYAKLADGLFGTDAQNGKFTDKYPVATGIFLSAIADPAVPDQARVTLSFDDELGKKHRNLAVVPVSFGIGKIFNATVAAAMAKMATDTEKKAGGDPFLLEYHVASTQGGGFMWAVRGDHGKYTLIVESSSPRTSLVADRVGLAMQSAAAWDWIAGTVWFNLQKDDFDFFVDHAYGAGATSKQNFKDFQLVPHNWLRLTVEPHLDKQFVSVGFEVIANDGQRLALAKAPASILAGATFQALVDRNMGNMLDQEAKKAGSSQSWQVPFYYDHPDGGGVVRVVAAGVKGLFSVAYAVESPRHALADAPFLPYEPVVFPAKDPKADVSCDKLGDPNITPAVQGTLNITFAVNKLILQSKELKGPLKGTVYCSVFKDSEVTITGPIEGATELESFNLPDADLQAATMPTYTTKPLLAGKYQALCYQDLDKDKNASKGDPVTLPIGSQEVNCNKNPVVVEFGLLNPG